MTQSFKTRLAVHGALLGLCLSAVACGRAEMTANGGPQAGAGALARALPEPASGSVSDQVLLGEDSDSPSRKAAEIHSLEILGARLVRCSVRPYGIGRRGQKIYGPLRSACSEVVVDGNLVRVIEAASGDGTALSWEIRVIPSSPTHGRDLWDVVIWDQDGRKVLESAAIPGTRVASPLDLTLTALELTPELSVYDSSLNQQ